MSRLYDALTALERKRPRPTASPVPLVEQEPRTYRRWPVITVVVVALCGAAAVTVLRSRPTAPPAPAVVSPPGTRTASGLDLRARAREAAVFGMVDEAEALLQQAIKLAPADAVAWNDLGVVLVRRAQLSRAIEAFKLSVALDARYAAAHRNLAVALEQAGKATEAVPHYRAFLALSPDDPERGRITERLARSR